MRVRPITILTAVSLLVVGCGTKDAPVEGLRRERFPVILSVGGQAVEVTSRDTVRIGMPLTLRILSFGSSGCVDVGETDVTVRGLSAEVRPYRYELVGGACLPIVLGLEHVVTLQFGDTGTATIRVVGNALPAAKAGATIIRTVRVVGR